ncbi:MAG: 3-phosphoshikimate 1-carboxyvinyltransferase [Candidatus Omnitrophica bacterium]|nr:3-phosphoshikimate 1-carboxyvinyltransferase [Candidatus Omnitrophota bacterium]
MYFRVPSVKKLKGAVSLPASKSYSIRAFFVALCGGASRIRGVFDSDDARAARRVAKTLGACVSPFSGGFSIRVPEFLQKKEFLKVDVAESGTSLRFVLPLLPFYAKKARIEGRGTLKGRPNHHLCQALRKAGVKIQGVGLKESIPISFEGGDLSSGKRVIDGSVSSQFISALMIAGPKAKGNTRLVMSGQLVSGDYVTMTRQILSRAGVDVRRISDREFLIKGGQSFKGLKDFYVPSDYGMAAFFMAAAALLPSDVVLKGYFDDRLVQSDAAILPFLKKMGLKLVRTSKSLRIKGPYSLKGGTFFLKDCPDLVPIMAVTAMFAKGVTRLKDIGHARVKESDRITDLRKELLKVGACITEKKDELVIYPDPQNYRGGVVLDPHHDHRLAMAFAVLGLKLGVTVKDVECTAKSYPGFVKALKELY